MKVGTSKTGFTIVELLIVVVVIAILAAITIVAYNGIQQRTVVSGVKSDLTSAAKAVELARVDASAYPTTLPSNVPQSRTTALSMSETSDGFCINGSSINNTTIQWRYESASGGLKEGLCSGPVLAGSEQGMNPNLVTSTNFTSGWGLNFQTGSGRTLTPRAGAPGDPYPTRPVLVLQNNATTTTTWAVVQGTNVNQAAMLNGQVYQRGFWVRKVGGFTGTISMFGYMDGGAANVTLNTGAAITPTNEWQYVTEQATAAKNGTSANLIYLPTNLGAYTTAGWSLEFQGFEIRRV